MDTKTCKQCKITKPLSDYHKAPRNKQGVKTICKDCHNGNLRQFYADNPAEHTREKQRQREYRESVKQQVFDYYGEYCACCGEAERIFLTLDHINNDGAQHKRELSKQANARSVGADKLWRAIIKDGFPNSYQILCYNCNCGKRDNGGICPHQEAKE